MLTAVRKAAQYAQVDALFSEHNSQRRIAQLTGIARMTIAKRIKKSGGSLAAPTALAKSPVQAGEVFELDEFWSFVGHKKLKVWCWLVVERARRRISWVWTLGSRDEGPLGKLWQSLPAHY